MPPAPFLHDDSGVLRFWVDCGEGKFVGASISKAALHYRFQADLSGADAVATYIAHQKEIDAAVRRRLAAGSLEPIMLREADVAARREPEYRRLGVNGASAC